MNNENTRAIEAIKKKLLGKDIDYEDAYAVMNQFSKRELGDIFVAYFAAASFREGFNDEELYFLTKAMVNTGKRFTFPGIVADKHSIGGLPGTRASLIIVPIIAAAGYLIPKTSSRAITTPAGTADCMEVLAPVTIPFENIANIVYKTGGCIVWGGHLGIAPADDIIIRVEEPLMFESYDKVIVSILAKKVAASSKLLILDIPVGPTMKIKYVKDALSFANRFSKLATRFNIEVKSEVNFQYQPSGNGIGPSLEAYDALRVLEQKKDRPRGLEDKALKIASRLLDMCFEKDHRKEDGLLVAEELLRAGKAYAKFCEIVAAQGGHPEPSSDAIHKAPFTKVIKSNENGTVLGLNNYHLSSIAKVLGAPIDKYAGLTIHKRMNDNVFKNDILIELFSTVEHKLVDAENALKQLSIYQIE